MQIHGIQARHHDNAGQKVTHVKAHMDHAGDGSRQRPCRQRGGQRPQGMDSAGDHQRGHGSAQRKAGIHRHIGKIEDLERDVHAQCENGVDQALFQYAQQLCHGKTSNA